MRWLPACLLPLVCSGCLPLMTSESLRSESEGDLIALLHETGVIDADHAGVVGMVLDESGVVMAIVSCSPAQEAEIRAGDVISGTQGTLSGRTGTDLHLMVSRDGISREVTLRRMDWRSVFEGKRCAGNPSNPRPPG